MCCSAVVWCGAYRIRWRRRRHVVHWAAASHSDNSSPEFSKYQSPGLCVMWRRLQWEGVGGVCECGCASWVPTVTSLTDCEGRCGPRSSLHWVFLGVTPCHLTNIYRRFGGAWCFHLQSQSRTGAWIAYPRRRRRCVLHSTRCNIPEDLNLNELQGFRKETMQVCFSALSPPKNLMFRDNEAPDSDGQTSMRVAIRDPGECAVTC